MGDLLALLGAEAALALTSRLAQRHGWRRLARECVVAGVALAVTVSTALLLTAIVDGGWSLVARRQWVTVGGAIIVPGVLVGRLVASWLHPPPWSPSRDGAWERRQDDERHS